MVNVVLAHRMWPLIEVELVIGRVFGGIFVDHAEGLGEEALVIEATPTGLDLLHEPFGIGEHRNPGVRAS